MSGTSPRTVTDYGYRHRTASTDDILKLVRQALDEFDERPLDVAACRAVRIANLVGDSRTAVRFSLEIKALGGDKQANGADTRALIADPSLWAHAASMAKQALPFRRTLMR